jgi:alpha-mannosidase
MGKPAAQAVIDHAITTLRQMTQLDVQPQWRIQAGYNAQEIHQALPNWSQWYLANINDKGHIAWPEDRIEIFLVQELLYPATLKDYPIANLTARLALTWWAEEAEVFVNGQSVQAGDLFDHSARVLLSEHLEPGASISLALRLVSPGHDLGALVRSRLILEQCDPNRLDLGMFVDELAVLQTYAQTFRPEILDEIVTAVDQIVWDKATDAIAFEASLSEVRQKLISLGDWIKQRKIYWSGHAHLDLAWLWPIAETWDVAERTFESVLSLQKEFADLPFCHSSPALYAWLEEHRPHLFRRIQQQVAAGRWEVAAGMWVEPELNCVSGESIVRQVLYGQRYTRDRFGDISRTVWLPDSFGFSWQLPQILKQGGIEYFLTQKLLWNDTTKFPHETFWWQAPDGTQILSLMLPPIGEGVDPIKMTTYAQTWESKTTLPFSLWLPGVGDHGGGPTRDMLQVGQRWENSPLFPTLQPTKAIEFCEQVFNSDAEFPVWNNELYLEFHRGCYTSHADQKRYNRRCEHLLTEAELFSSIATLLNDRPYPKLELETAWKKVLFNQFHDILPGSSIRQVYEDADPDWEAAQQTAMTLKENALSAIAAQIQPPQSPHSTALPIVVFNSLNWARSEVVLWKLPDAVTGQGEVRDQEGTILPGIYDTATHAIRFLARDIPSIGYRLFWYIPGNEEPGSSPAIAPDREWILENACLRIEVCPETGNLLSLWDKQQQRECLSAPGNVLQFFKDEGQYWDAWNIDPNYAKYPLREAEVEKIQWLSQEPLQQRLRVVRLWNNSTFTQDYVLNQDANLLLIETKAYWQEVHVLVKAAFPLTVTADNATYEIPCGAIQRPTLPNPDLPDWEQTKWEVPALHWADLTDRDGNYGVSILNDCKYGYDAQANQLRLTLLRGSRWPDPDCDRGFHSFTYAIYPHTGSWQTAQTVRCGYELNRPLICIQPAVQNASESLPPVHSLLNSSARNLVLMAFKQSEDSDQNWILRHHEAHGETAAIDWRINLPVSTLGQTDGLEQLTASTPEKIAAWEIQSILLSTSARVELWPN